MDEWIENLKVGDKVIVDNYWHGGQIATVKRLTKAQIILNSGHKFWKKDGYEVGGKGCRGFSIRTIIKEATEDRVFRIRERQLRAKTERELPEKINEADMETLQKIRHLLGMENDI